jgi:hypothetical protein
MWHQYDVFLNRPLLCVVQTLHVYNTRRMMHRPYPHHATLDEHATDVSQTEASFLLGRISLGQSVVGKYPK